MQISLTLPGSLNDGPEKFFVLNLHTFLDIPQLRNGANRLLTRANGLLNGANGLLARANELLNGANELLNGANG